MPENQEIGIISREITTLRNQIKRLRSRYQERTERIELQAKQALAEVKLEAHQIQREIKEEVEPLRSRLALLDDIIYSQFFPQGASGEAETGEEA